MKRALLLMLFCCGAALLWAGGFWEKKKFPDWDEKDVQKIARDSPWARQIEVTMGVPGGGAGGGGGRGGGRRGGGGGGGGDMSGDMGGGDVGGGIPGGRGGGGGGGGGSEGSWSPPATTIIVRCHSALPMKQAFQVAKFGKEVTASPEAQKVFARQETHYIFGFDSVPFSLLRGAKVEELKDKAFLKVKGKELIPAESIQVDKSQRGLLVIMFFPRKDHVIMLEDGDVEVQLKLPTRDLKRSFKLKDMVYGGKLEI